MNNIAIPMNLFADWTGTGRITSMTCINRLIKICSVLTFYIYETNDIIIFFVLFKYALKCKNSSLRQKCQSTL